ncbi:conserved hypothetical protein [Lebetimonas natsushimae]|uniref:MSHA biogenesis protein MshK n=1 Tax=Lebetimonas natsushimae TaxID=1936991 RepID=A0A292YC40_9BACT|nr:hypothetical protein [Lebetimonas natsushimae]GAX87079.1 conserved hypothetical protein [Lebetimonas natsushimae]
MRYIFLFLGVVLFADISNVLLKLDKIENYKPVFKKIYFIKCNKIKNVSEKSIVNKQSELKLKAIFNNKALINNMWVKKGDLINGFRVIKIYSKEVVLKKENKIIILTFNNNLLKVEK